MNRQGALSTIIVAIISITFLVIILMNFLAPEGILPTIANAADWIADKTLSGLKKEKFEKTTIEVEKNIDEAYENMVSALRQEGAGPCLINTLPFTKDLKDFKIILSRANGDTFIQLVNKRKQNVKRNTISGKTPCVIGEGSAAQNFYDNYLKDNPCNVNCPIEYSIANIEFSESDTIYVNQQKRDIEDISLLFKTRDGNICFFPTYNAWFKGCHGRIEGLDKDCIAKIKNIFTTCSKGTELKPQFDECGAIRYCYDNLGIQNARPDLPCTFTTPRAFFKSKENCVKGSMCIKEHTTTITAKICDDGNKEISPTGEYIFVWPKSGQR